MPSIPSLAAFAELFPTNESCFRFLLQNDVFYEEYNCPHCNQPMTRRDDIGFFRCFRTNCLKKGTRFTIKIGTFFHWSKLNYIDILRLGQLWLSKATVETAEILSGHSHQTVTTFYGHFRQLVTAALRPEDQVIGGDGVEVQIDETKLGKRKYHRGHMVEGVWVLVGIEKKENGNIFLIPLPDRSASTIIPIICDHVKMGTTIVTDMWKAYSNLNKHDFNHMTVNHSVTFRDPISGVNTNTAEGLNSGIKRRIPPRNRVAYGIEFHLGEYAWRRQNRECLFDSLIKAMSDIHYDF